MPNMDRLTAALEDYSMRKQLPLRQTAQKPVLKYHPHMSKQAQVLNQSDIVHIRPDTGGRRTHSGHSGHSAHSATSHGSTGNTIGSSPYRLSKAHFTGTDNSTVVPMTNTLGSYLGGTTYIAPSNIGKPSPPSQAKNHANPYTRPLSAKDIVSDLQQQQKTAKKSTSSTSQIAPAPGLLTRNEAPISFPVNAFLRPQSAIKKNAVAPTTTGNVSYICFKD